MELLFVIKGFDEEFRYGQAEFRDQVRNIDFSNQIELPRVQNKVIDW